MKKYLVTTKWNAELQKMKKKTFNNYTAPRNEKVSQNFENLHLEKKICWEKMSEVVKVLWKNEKLVHNNITKK